MCESQQGACLSGMRPSVNAGCGPFTPLDTSGPLSKMIVDTKCFSLLFCDTAEPNCTQKTWMRKSKLGRMSSWRDVDSPDSHRPPGPTGTGESPGVPHLPQQGVPSPVGGLPGLGSLHPPLTLGQGEMASFSEGGDWPDGASPGQQKEVTASVFLGLLPNWGRGSRPQRINCLHREPLKPVQTAWA